MSRRKQGRPQQRKTLDSLEQENDLLVCGDCQTSFPLHDIVQFIRHKKLCCADKENLQEDCRKQANNNNERNGDDDDDDNDNEEHSGDEDVDGEGVVSVDKSRRAADGGDEDGGDEEEEDEEDEDEENRGKKEVVGGGGGLDDDDGPADLSNKPKVGAPDKNRKASAEEKDGKREARDKERSSSSSSSSGREQRTPLRQKQVADAESNTTHSEPSRFVCETCRSTYTSAWALLQHAQKEHGMKIYTSPGSSTSSSSTHSQSLPPAPSSLSPIDLVVASPRSAMDHHHRSAPSAGSAGSASPYPVHAHNPFTSPFRLPLDTRLPHPTSLSPFPRPPSFDLDLINDYRLRPQFLGRPATGLEPPAFHHSPFDRARTHMSPALESPYDYYSMRLKQLASSPVATVAAKAQFSSAQPPTPGVAATPTSTKPESPCVEPSAAGSPRGVNSASLSSPGLALPPKLKSCEFCGKSFRFQSNLVVHRRSHTGEKPFRCPMCPHACTQQSKLKRHMKTHSMKPDGSTSPSDAAAAEKADDDDDEDEEEEEEEEEMEDEEEMIEEEMNEEEREVLERMKASKAAEEGAEPGEIRHDAKRIKLEHNGETKVEPEEVEEEEEEQPSDLSMKPKASSKPVESLLSEVMKNSGLTSIQTYNEAFQAALAESQVNGKDKAAEERAGSVKSGLSHDGEDTPRSASPKSPHPAAAKREKDGDKESDKSNQKEHVFLGATDLLSKGLKRDAAGTPTSWPSSVDSLVSGGMDPVAASAAYSRLHHPWLYPDNPVRLFFPGYPPRFPPHARDLSLSAEGHNGLSLSPSVSTASSALKSSSDSPSIPALFKPGLSSPPSFPTHHARHGTSGSSSSSPTSNLLLPSNGGGTPRKENRRNDTCEYCGKVFKNCSNLTVHRRSHTGEKPYKCSLCSYACAQSSKLTRHMKTHGRLGKDVYTCKFCQMPFSVPSTLEKHMRKCVENRNARLLAADAGDLSSEASNGEVNRSTDSTTGVF